MQKLIVKQLITLVTSCVLAAPLWASETTNRIGITMVDIPAGNFLMGSCIWDSKIVEENKKREFLGQAPLSGNCANPDRDALNSETPQHRVSVPAFQMGKTEVTLGQFKKFIAAAGRSDLIDEDFMKSNHFGDNAPVVRVSWNAAQYFVQWLNSQEGGGYRLPSEAEWEYACRAGSNTQYCGSNDANSVAWHSANSGNDLHKSPVASKKTNAFGLYDMSGNVQEWVQDCWNDNYSGAPMDGSAWTSGQCESRVLRGGSSDHYTRDIRAAYRASTIPGTRDYSNGFRLARTR